VSADRDATTGFATNVLCDGGAGKPAVACASGAFVYLGTTTPGLTGSIGNTVTIHKNLRLYALLDFKRGYIEQSTTELLRCTGATGTALCRQNYYPQEFSPLVLAEAVVGAATQGYQDYYYQSGNFVKLREVSATYTIPQKWARGFSRASFTLAARELHTWTKFHGLDPEAYYYLSTSPINGSDQAILPPLSRIIGTFNLAWRDQCDHRHIESSRLFRFWPRSPATTSRACSNRTPVRFPRRTPTRRRMRSSS
jgi:hypothetical protein